MRAERELRAAAVERRQRPNRSNAFAPNRHHSSASATKAPLQSADIKRRSRRPALPSRNVAAAVMSRPRSGQRALSIRQVSKLTAVAATLLGTLIRALAKEVNF